MTVLEKMQAVIDQYKETPQGMICSSFPCDTYKENACPMLCPIRNLCSGAGNEEFLRYATEYVEQHTRKADNATDKKQTAQDKVECAVCEQDFDPSKEGGSINDVCFTCEARGK